MIEPISKIQQAEVIAQTGYFVARAGAVLDQEFSHVDVVFDLRGSAAGMFKLKHRDCWIRYNPWLFAKYYEESLANTVPHEVAHYIVHRMYGLHRVRPHGAEWRSVMTAFGVAPTVTGNYDLGGIPHRRQRRFDYRCECRNHELSTRRHNAVLQGRSRYQCRLCEGELLPVEQI